MISIDDIRRPVEGEITAYESVLRESFSSGFPPVQAILDHVISGGGKGIRPLLALLCAALHNPRPGALPPRSRLAAMLVEMVHNASLVHDDVVDRSSMRRGRPSVEARFRTSAAVLAGDYILARCYALGLEAGAHDILGRITRSMEELCEGELLQNECSERPDTMTRAAYYDIIYKKTATLIGTSCAVGVVSTGAPDDDAQRMKHFGDMLGMAFQIKDDILDYGDPASTGKPRLGDLRERKVNLPLLAVIEGSTPERAAHIADLLRNADSDPANIELLDDMVAAGGGMELAAAAMNDFTARARAVLDYYPACAIRDSLCAMCSLVAQREK